MRDQLAYQAQRSWIQSCLPVVVGTQGTSESKIVGSEQQQAWNVRCFQRSCKSCEQPMRAAATDEVPNGGWIGWAAPGPNAPDDGKLDQDDRCSPTASGGPEHIYWPGLSKLMPGTYRVFVHFYQQCRESGVGPGEADPDETSVPRLRLVYGNDPYFFPGQGNPDLVMRSRWTSPNGPARAWCEFGRFDDVGNVQWGVPAGFPLCPPPDIGPPVPGVPPQFP